MASIGEAFIDVHANTDPFDRELARDLDKAADDSEAELNKTGNKIGDKVSDGISVELKRRGKSFAKAVGDGTKNTVVFIRSLFRFDRIGLRRQGRDIGDTITEEIRESFDNASRKGGVFSKLGQGLADAIGAGFNVSGRSPLIALLLPAIAALVGLVLAAVQAVNALVAVLFIVPGLLASIGLQAGVLVIAFQGVGTAVQGAFAAKNAKELREALRPLTRSARSFVKELLPLRTLFHDIGRAVQEGFFSRLAGVITGIRKALGPSLVQGFGAVARALGDFVRSFGELLASPGFVKFFNTLVPATVRWINTLGQGLFGKRGFITALINMATVLMPFMEKFGEIIIRNLETFAALMFRLGTDPNTTAWLDSMAATLQLVFDLLFKLGEFMFVLFAQIDAQGGKQIFTELIRAIEMINFFLASPAGAKAIEGLINLGIIGIKVTTGLILGILAISAALQVFAEWLKDSFIPAVIADIKTLGSALVAGATFVGVWIERIVGAIRRFFVALDQTGSRWRSNFIGFIAAVVVKIAELILKLKGLPLTITSAFKNFGGLLVNAGRNLVQGLINGINQKIQALKNVIAALVNMIANFLPGSPAEEGPLSGQGYVKLRGQRMMQDLIEGIRSEVPELRDASLTATSNIVFGSNSVQVNVAGETPDVNRARAMGNAMGMSAAQMIATRNTRLAVRTL